MPLVEPVPVVGTDDLGTVHFIGIGGVSMSGIARLMAERGVRVTGCDREESAAVAALRAAGVDVAIGHDPGHLHGVDTVVYNSARTPANASELEAIGGRRRLHRSAALACLMVGRDGVAVAGSHGKTTTSGMVVAALSSLDPGYMVGSILADSGVGAHDGTGDVFVIEADESDGSFLQYDCGVVVVTNVEADHLDNWGTPEGYVDGFQRLLAKDTVRVAVLNADDAPSRPLIDAARARGLAVVTFGESADADVVLADLVDTGMSARARVTYRGEGGDLELRVPGAYNLRNAAAAYAVARLLGVPDAEARAALGRFGGTARRFQPVGVAGGVRVIDDYAHHPTEVAATLTAARSAAGQGRVVAVFQPHLFSRTRDFADDFGAALAAADEVVVCDIYPAREEPIEGVTGALVADAVRRHGGRVAYVPELADVPEVVVALVHPGDAVFTIGAGSVTTLGPRIVARLGEPA